MLFKFLLIMVFLSVDFPFPSQASSKNCSPQWVKLNNSTVCFGAKGDQFGGFTINRNIFVSQFMIVHRSGKVTCNRHLYTGSYWGCIPNRSELITILTDNNNKILAPEASKVNSGGAYALAGYDSSSSVLVFCENKKAHCLPANTGLRLWYGQDLKGFTESDNGGRTCADVYGLLAN
ncbi:uncharacterized protein [Montipora foliosa]|uniref:uncharacterized protein n=1 Tax=Montipora foliosa TaxID=591990 RepID=UPI0035F104D5